MRLPIVIVSVFTGVVAGCPGPGPGDGTPPPPPRTTFAFEPIDVSGVDPRWGAAATGDFVVGGVNTSMVVTSDIYRLTGKDGAVDAQLIANMDTPRMCNCAMFDEKRHELLVVGGRDAQFLDNNDAEIVNTETFAHIAIDANGAADHPVGCHAFFSKTADKGYVFGGLDSNSGFTGNMYRYDPDAHSLTLITAPGPNARYDAGVHQLADGSILLVSGMGASLVGGAVFYQDIWRFDPSTETWSEVPTTSTTLPKGRRYPWTSVAPDESILLFGFGSDSGTGESVLGDLWSFTFATGEWAEVPVDGGLPDARGFTYNWRGPPDSAGALVFGTDAALGVFDDAYAMRVPDALAGAWH